MRKFSEIKAFEDIFEIFCLPKARVIGKEVRNGGSLGNTAPQLWGQVFSSGAAEILKALPHILNDSLYGWTCDYDPQTDTFIYMVCALTPADTPVPEGYVYRDIPKTLCAKGLYGEDMGKTLERISSMRYEPNWEPYGWNAELYLDAEEANPPKLVETPWHWIVPVKAAENHAAAELLEILEKFASCGWDLIDKPSQDWLDGQENREELIAAIKEADKQCGSCGCEFDPLYKRALELLINEMVIETPRLILRRFTADDWQDLLEIARSKEASTYAYTDFTWPTDENWAKESAAYMATDNDMWAMARQDDGKVICFINCNGMNEAGYMDIGHVMNMAYAGQGYEEEGLTALYRYVFDTTDAVGITAGWALEDKEKTTPLLSMGMEIIGQDTGNAFDGSGRTFTHCILQITKEQWNTRTSQEETV